VVNEILIGIMADSHDNLESIEKAVKVFDQESVDLVVHAGDLISPFTAKIFRKLNSQFLAVFGNNDGERHGLRMAYKNLCYLEDFREFKSGDKLMAIIHGSNQNIVEAISSCGKYDVLVRGHTHKVEIIGGETLIINPGETCGYLSGNQTVVIFDSNDLNYQVIHI
jgi:putative phosphoesterase